MRKIPHWKATITGTGFGSSVEFDGQPIPDLAKIEMIVDPGGQPRLRLEIAPLDFEIASAPRHSVGGDK